MNTFFSQLKKDTEQIRLTQDERESIRHALEGAMQGEGLVKSPIQVFPSPFFFFDQKFLSPVAFVLALTIAGGGTAYAAESAIPGDVLYSVKRSVNESVRSALAQSAEAKAHWHAEAAHRRMQEAETLAARGGLTAEVKVDLEENLDSHAEALEESIALVEEKDPVTAEEISTKFESSILAHSALLARLGGGGGNDASRFESARFAEKLKERGEKIAFATRSASVKAERADNGDIALMATAPAPEGTSTMSASIVIRDSGDDAIIERLELSASTTLEEAHLKLNTLEATLDATTSARVKAQIGKIRALLENFKRERMEGFAEKPNIQKLLRDASTVKAFLEAQEKFKGYLLLPAPGVSENGDTDEDTEQSDQDPLPLNPPVRTVI